MALLSLIPKVFYDDIKVGIDFFVDGAGFTTVYQEEKFCIIKRDHIKIQLVEDAEYAAKDRPEIRFETDDIDAYYQEIVERRPQILHPNLRRIKIQPWGLKEFALLDKTTVCIIIQQSV